MIVVARSWLPVVPVRDARRQSLAQQDAGLYGVIVAIVGGF
jgi:hypothetical protein